MREREAPTCKKEYIQRGGIVRDVIVAMPGLWKSRGVMWQELSGRTQRLREGRLILPALSGGRS